jgi:hypothetical protein
VDDYSRYVLACDAFLRPSYGVTAASFRRVFRTYGLPQVIRTDNGAPFAHSFSLARLSPLAVWWLHLGITPELIEPARPDQNGRHERFHRTLKSEATLPPSVSRAAQQRRFTRYRRDFNENRPHEALGQKPPGEVYKPSKRQMPKSLPTFSYPAHFEQRRVSGNRYVAFHGRQIPVKKVLPMSSGLLLPMSLDAHIAGSPGAGRNSTFNIRNSKFIIRAASNHSLGTSSNGCQISD